ncbi:PRC and DUF2382 domain-containing protein [Spirillospora sp. NPDC047279]|uniref:PRC and DUF2382 domain-containing protein n=1 Tax=Spirillospora sp. NPDC047279 TaxID=3155478 RepID=UPI0033CEA1EE
MADMGGLEQLHGQTVVDADGNKVGTIKQVWVDDRTGNPAWATVHTGLFGHKESFVPLQGSRPLAEDQLQVPVSKDNVKDAPRVEPEDGHIDERQQEALYQHYGLAADPRQQDVPNRREAQASSSADVRARPGQGRSDRASADRASADRGSPDQRPMVRSEERLKVGKEQTETGHVRLRKVVVTEQQQVSVPVSHEEVRVVREPVSAADRDRTTGRIGEEEREVTLHAERAVVDTEVVPVEQVRLETEVVTEQEQVGGKVRKERIEVDDSGQNVTAKGDRSSRRKDRPRPSAG